MKLFNIPNLFSLGNLLCGCIATLNVIEANLYGAAICVGIAAVLDFLDGFAARGLKQFSPIGKDLDSLADMVTFGVVPGMVMFQLIKFGIAQEAPDAFHWIVRDYLPYLGFIVPLFSGLRLAKFNVDTNQKESFIGLPTLANAVMIVTIPVALGLTQAAFIGMGHSFDATISAEDSENLNAYLQRTGIVFPGNSSAQILWDTNAPEPVLLDQIRLMVLNPWFTSALSVIMSFLLISPFPMFSFKVKSVNWKGNEVRYIFLLLSVGLLAVLQLKALPLIIVLYILMSLVNGVVKKRG